MSSLTRALLVLVVAVAFITISSVDGYSIHGLSLKSKAPTKEQQYLSERQAAAEAELVELGISLHHEQLPISKIDLTAKWTGVVKVQPTFADVSSDSGFPTNVVGEQLVNPGAAHITFPPIKTVPHALEIVPADEFTSITRIQSLFEHFTQQSVAAKSWLRQAHIKNHGCITGRLTINNNIPKNLQVGLFATAGQDFNVLIRPSNGAGTGFVRGNDDFNVGSDLKPDNRGFALKIFGVKGPKPFVDGDQNADTQDLMFATGKAPFVDNHSEALAFFTALNTGAMGKYLLANPKIAFNFLATAASGYVQSLLHGTFHGNMPMAMGPHQAVRFHLEPCSGNPFTIKFPSTNLFRELLAASLDPTQPGPDSCFTLQVQEYVNEHLTPIEVGTATWDVPLINVAVLHIPKQNLDIDETWCRQVGFNSWHSLSEHQPLGGIQRIRRAVYTNMQKMRHSIQGVATTEPTWSQVLAARHTLNGHSVNPALQQNANPPKIAGQSPAWGALQPKSK